MEAKHISGSKWSIHQDGSEVEIVVGATSADDAIRIYEEARSPRPPDQYSYASAIDARVEKVALSRGYSSASTLASYVNSTVPAWSAEAVAFVAWRDAVWSYAYAQLSAVQSGSRPQPTVDELVAELPTITWPA